MENKNNLGTIIDGVAASSHVDSSGEILDIEGMDISSLGSVDSILNFEHNSKDHPSQVCGKVTFAKKIFKASDCSNDRERYFWDFCKKPFVYVKGELFDHPDLDHDGARNVAALLRYDNRDKGKKARHLISFSIEGGKIEKKGMTVTKSIARDLALTIKHCNKMCIVEILEDVKTRKDLYKKEANNNDLEPMIKNEFRRILVSDIKNSTLNPLQDIKKSDWKSNTPTQKEIKEIKLPKNIIKVSKYESDNNMRKALIAGIANVSPDSKTGMAALAVEDLDKKKIKVMKKNENAHFFAQPHSIFSVENPYHPTNHSISHEDMINKLKNKGFDVEPLKGKYGNEENSIVVKNPSEQQKNVLNHIARKLGQDSIIHSDGQNHQMLYLHGEKAGKHLKGVGTQVHDQKPDDFYSTTTSGTHFTHNFDFDNLHKSEVDKLEKMSRPLMQNKELGLGQDPRMDVKVVDPEKEYKIKPTPKSKEKIVTAPELESKKLQNKASLKTFKKQPGDILTPKENVQIGKKVYKDHVKAKEDGSEVYGQNVGDPDFGINTSYTFKKPNQPKNEIGPEIHETTHGFFSDVANKHGKEHSKQLASHILNNFFHPKDLEKVKSFIKDRGYDESNPHFNEEHISHISDIINRPSVRKEFLDHASHTKNLKPGSSPEDVAMAQELDRRMHKRLNRGWGSAVSFIKDTNSLKQFLNQVKPTKINKKIDKK